MNLVRLLFFLLMSSSSVLIASADADAVASWYLMSRHGECSEISALQRKVPDMGGIDDPQAFIRLMEARGYRVIAEEPAEFQGQAVQVSVSAQGLGLLFVKGDLCREFIGR